MSQNSGFNIPQSNQQPLNNQSQEGVHNYSNQYFDLNSQSTPPPAPKKPKFDYSRIKNFLIKRWWLVIAVVLVTSLGILGVYALTQFNRTPEVIGTYTNISVKVEAPTSLSKGSPDTWKVTVENLENTVLKDVEVNFKFDSGFEFIRHINPSPENPEGSRYKFSRLEAAGESGSQAIVQIQGTTKANIDTEIILQGEVLYTPDALIRFQNQGRLGSNVNTRRSVPIPPTRTNTTAARVRIQLDSPTASVPNNSEVVLSLTFSNTSDREINDLRLRMRYPEGFSYSSSELCGGNTTQTCRVNPDDSNNIWNINNLPRLQEQKLKLRGTLSASSSGITRSFQADIEIKQSNNNYQSVATTSKDIAVEAKPLTVSTMISGKESDPTFQEGETLNFTITYENQGTTNVRGVEITGTVEDPASLLDWNTVQFNSGGRGTAQNNSVKWAGNNVSQLANLGVKNKGQLSFTLKVKSGADFIKTFRPQSDYIIMPKVQAQAINVQQIQADGPEYLAKGDVGFTQRIVSREIDGTQDNRRRFGVIWTITTKQNQVNQIQVRTRTSLPTSAWTPSSITPIARASQLTYNPTNGDILWTVGNVQSYAGISNPIVTISFDLVVELGINENINQTQLLDQVILEGVDDSTNASYTKSVGPANASR